jgi:hypothetical protein
MKLHRLSQPSESALTVTQQSLAESPVRRSQPSESAIRVSHPIYRPTRSESTIRVSRPSQLSESAVRVTVRLLGPSQPSASAVRVSRPGQLSESAVCVTVRLLGPSQPSASAVRVSRPSPPSELAVRVTVRLSPSQPSASVVQVGRPTRSESAVRISRPNLNQPFESAVRVSCPSHPSDPYSDSDARAHRRRARAWQLPPLARRPARARNRWDGGGGRRSVKRDPARRPARHAGRGSGVRNASGGGARNAGSFCGAAGPSAQVLVGPGYMTRTAPDLKPGGRGPGARPPPIQTQTSVPPATPGGWQTVGERSEGADDHRPSRRLERWHYRESRQLCLPHGTRPRMGHAAPLAATRQHCSMAARQHSCTAALHQGSTAAGQQGSTGPLPLQSAIPSTASSGAIHKLWGIRRDYSTR